MDEEKTNIENTEVKAVKDVGEGSKSETTSLFKQTNAATKRLEKANAKTEEMLKQQEEIITRQEELYAKKQLGGMSEAGQQAEKPKEETPQEYKDRVMRGEA